MANLAIDNSAAGNLDMGTLELGALEAGNVEVGRVEVGRVEALWRYPVKSMQGECLPRLAVDAGGVRGDRAYALWDHATSRVASAKNPLLWRSLLAYEARYSSEPQPGAAPPAVAITPVADRGSAPMLTSDPAIHASLSELLGRELTLLDQAPDQVSLDQYWPQVPERPFHNNEVNELRLPEGTFFDACQVHAITTSTLERYRELEPELDFAVERFRPNLIIQPTAGQGDGFVEEAWIGGYLQIGESLRLRVIDGCPRCVVTTLAQNLPQGQIPQTLEILRATARHNKVVAGIRLAVENPGPIALGDPVFYIPVSN